MIFITGSDGFVGSKLVSKLKELKMEFKELKGDIRKYTNVKKQMKDCDIVIHLAILQNIMVGEEKQFEYWDVNVNGTFNVVQAALENGVEKFILISSLATVYTRNTTYGLTKVIQEEILKTYYKRMKFVILRSVSIYDGKHGTIGWLLNSRYPEIYGDGSQIRDFIHVQDIVKVLIQTINWNGGSFGCDLGTGRGISMRELVELVGKPYKFVPNPLEKIDPAFSVANPVPAQKILGFIARDYRGVIKKWKLLSHTITDSI